MGEGILRVYGRNTSCNDDAITGLELVVILGVLVGGGAILLLCMSGGETSGLIRTFPEGAAAESAYISGDNLQPVGSVFGFPAVNGMLNKAEVRFAHPDPGKLGAVRMTLSLFLGDTGAIDMDRVKVNWATRGSYEPIGQTSSPLLVCPNWTITGKYNMLPGHAADSDTWLEPREQFEILVCPSTGVQPYGTFTLTLRPDGSAMPLTVTRKSPPVIHPVMKLG